MTRQARPQPLPIAIRALLPPSNAGPNHPLPSPSAAILGPLPPTSAIHLALNWLALSDLPEYRAENATPASTKPFGRVLLITGPKESFADPIEEDDEDWLRDHGGHYGVSHRLKRVDIRYCPTPDHLLLLLTLLSVEDRASGKDPQNLGYRPGLVILCDLARLFMEAVEGHENLPPEEMEGVKEEGEMRLKHDISLAGYMNVMAAARSSAEHFSSLDTSEPATQLIILEPSLSSFSSLPILRPSTADVMEAKMSVPTRERRVRIQDGLKWMFGSHAVGAVEELMPEDIAYPSHTFTLSTYPNEAFAMIRRRFESSRARPLAPPEEGVEGDRGGWCWDWCDPVVTSP